MSPRCLDFGDADVGTLKSLPLTLTNLSDLTAHVMVKFASKVLHCTREEVNIPARQSSRIKIDIYPRKINPDYRKQIVIVNLQNRDNDQVIEVITI